MTTRLAEFMTADQGAQLEALLAEEGLTLDPPDPDAELLVSPSGFSAPLEPDMAARHEPFPLTDIQQGYWLGRGAGFELGAVSCYGYVEIECAALDVGRLEQALALVITRHDMLRMHILPHGMQQIADHLPSPLIRHRDLSLLSPDDAERHLLDIRTEMAQQVLDTSRAPLFDIRVSGLRDGAARLHIGIDSLICDQASLRLILRDLISAYEAPSRLRPPAAIGFRDYVLAQASQTQSAARAAARSYWMERLDDMAPAPALPRGIPWDTITRPTFQRIETSLDEVAWTAFQTYAAALGVTPSNALAAAFALTLGRWARQDRLTLNLTLFDRQPVHPDIAEVVGDFTAVTLLDIDMTGRPSFDALCRTIQGRLLEDIQHSAFSGVEVLREMARRTGRPGQALMPVVFTSMIGLGRLEAGSNPRSQDTEIPSGFGTRGYTLSQTPQVALDHHIYERSGRLDINWDFCVEAYPAGLIADMFSAFAALVNRLAHESSAWTSLLAPPLPNHQVQRRAAYNQSPAAHRTKHATLPGAVVATLDAMGTADNSQAKAALITSERTLSYDDVSCLAETWARDLESLGLGRGDRVLIVMPKSWQQGVAALAVTALGAAYVPISPDTPQARLEAIQTVVSAKAVMTVSDGAVCLGEVPVLVCRNGETPDTDHLTIRPGVSADDVAYIIFTSGSTGLPKGVVIDHRGALNTIDDVNGRFGITAADRVLALSAFGFDLSVYDLFGVLAAGGTVVLPDPDRTRDPEHWAALMRDHGVTLWNSVPALLHMLVAYLDHHPTETPATLRMAWLSGDWIPLDLPDAIRRHWPNITLISMGGATEASIWSIYHPIGTVDPAWTSIPYGRPLGGQGMHVLDPDLTLSPDWTPGDIYISGVGLALGYEGDVNKTAASFLTHPDSGQRLYRTGDLGLFHPDGHMVFLGRQDQQVKINGFRVELGDIEAALTRHPEIRSAAAIGVGAAGRGQSGHQSEPNRGTHGLAAFIIPNSVDTKPATTRAGGTNNPSLFAQPRLTPEAGQRAWDALLTAGHSAQEHSMGSRDGAWARTYFAAIETMALAMMNQTVETLALFPKGAPVRSVPDLLEAAGLQSRYTTLMAQWCDALTEAGWLACEGKGYRRVATGPTEADLDTAVSAVRSLVSGDTALETLLRFYLSCHAHHGTMLRGETEPLAVLFPETDWSVTESLYETQPLARYLNTIVAHVCAAAAEAWQKPNLHVLELGAGTGATTAAVLPALTGHLARYCFSDLSPVFLSRAEARFGQDKALSPIRIDINHPLLSQTRDQTPFDMVIAANVLHDAVTLRRTLEFVHDALTPNGLLVLVEGFQSHPILSVSVGFLEGLSAFADERRSSGSPFLSEDQWRDWLHDAGFTTVAAFPDRNHPSRAHGQAVIVAQRNSGRGCLDVDQARAWVARQLPDYMVPATIHAVDRLPLTANGKVDRQALAEQTGPSPSQTSNTFVAPEGEIQTILADIWQEGLGLGLDRIGATQSLFELGGDSLFAVQMNNRISDVFEIKIPLLDILRAPTIAAIAPLVEAALQADLASREVTP